MDILSLVIGIFLGSIIGSYFATRRIFKELRKVSPGLYSFILTSDDLILEELNYFREAYRKKCLELLKYIK